MPPWRVAHYARAVPARLVVLASGAGTTFAALLQAAREPSYGGDVVALVVDRDGTGAQHKAEAAGVPVHVVRRDDFADRAGFDLAVERLVANLAPDLVVCAGWMKVLSPSFVQRFRTVNTHPSLLPAFPGSHAVREALAYGVTVTGCTVHRVDEGVDTGPVLAQAAVPVLEGDDEDSLRARIQGVERVLYVETIQRLIRESA